MATSSNNTTSSSSNYREVPLSSFLNLPQPPSLFDPHLPAFRPSSSLQAQPQPTTVTPSTSSSPSRPNNSSSKKRSRASRRAPTTVLTTDTSNFRAMVQEFTGFPAPPFPPSSTPFPLRPRLDLSSSPYNLSRPFPQKFPGPTPSSLLDAINANINSTSSSYPFVNQQSSLIGGGPLLAPQFGDLGSLIAASDAMQLQQQQQPAAAGLPSWAADRQEFGEGRGRDHDQGESSTPHDFQPEKRQKTTDGVIESWIHSSD